MTPLMKPEPKRINPHSFRSLTMNSSSREIRKSRFAWLVSESFFQAVLLVGVVSVIVEQAGALNFIA